MPSLSEKFPQYHIQLTMKTAENSIPLSTLIARKQTTDIQCFQYVAGQ